MGKSFYEIDSAKSMALARNFVRAGGGLSRSWPKVVVWELITATLRPP